MNHFLFKVAIFVSILISNVENYKELVSAFTPNSGRLSKNKIKTSEDFYVETLNFADLPSIFELATNQFLPQCRNVNDIFSLNWQLLRIFTPKLLLPEYIGHKIIGIKYNYDDQLVGFVDLSLQQYCGSTDSLQQTSLPERIRKHGKNNLRPYLSNLLIAPKFRRQGLGKRLIKECEKEAHHHGFHEIYLHVETLTLPALSLYLNQNFTILRQFQDIGLLFMCKKF